MHAGKIWCVYLLQKHDSRINCYLKMNNCLFVYFYLAGLIAINNNNNNGYFYISF